MNRTVARAGRGLAGLSLLALATAGCAGDSEKRSITAASVNGKPGFRPATVTVQKGDHVKLTVNNAGDRTHGFAIEGYGVREEVAVNTPITVKFRADKPGTYKIFCQLHPAHQQATLVVQ